MSKPKKAAPAAAAIAKRKEPADPGPFRAQVEHLPIDALVPNPKNARVHSKEQLEKIAGSIRQYGFLIPLVVGPGNALVAGHGRLEAARLLGLAEVPVVRAAHLTPEQMRAFALADNRLTELAAWDFPTLKDELAGLFKGGADLDSLGFDAGFLLQLDITGFERPTFGKGEDPRDYPGERRPATKNDRWLFVQFYEDESRWKEVSAAVVGHLKGKSAHEVDAEWFYRLVTAARQPEAGA